MFDTMTARDLLILFAQIAVDAAELGRRLVQLDQAADAETDPAAELDLLLSVKIAIAALTEKAEMSHAINLECARRDAEAEQLRITDDEH